MLKILAFIIELLICICVLWVTAFLSTLVHELGHALAYLLATRDRQWHIRVGSGKKLLETKMLTVKLLVFDGYFAPAENRIDSKGKLIAMLLGGPIASLILVIVLALLKFGGISWESEILATGSIEFFLDFALFCNAYLFVFSVLPVHYLFGEIRGMATDGLQILNAIKHKEKP